MKFNNFLLFFKIFVLNVKKFPSANKYAQKSSLLTQNLGRYCLTPESMEYRVRGFTFGIAPK
ncbi:hypothetical protein SpAn4DRAFT_0123 [Sporomusa ovata]|uniref:Uncharacterized protein n=1 Tax=Sporomusa ovata TaxID=2378 RepID=A0A0U1L1Y4_9FIRM|nr:hypothetical protein SpAn4DRAFT_0123 [Sporomusa ovata]